MADDHDTEGGQQNPGSDPQPPLHPVEQLYAKYYKLLLSVAIGKMQVPLTDAECIVQEAFAGYLKGRRTIRHPEGWLVRAVYHLSADYWRRSKRYTELPDRFNDVPDPAAANLEARTIALLTVARVFDQLRERCRSLLVRHVVDKETAREIAASLTTTIRYAEKLLHTCMEEARRIFRQLKEQRR